MKKNNLSLYVEDLISMWIEWVGVDEIAQNKKLSFQERRQAAERCEELLQKRYRTIEKIDKLFE